MWTQSTIFLNFFPPSSFGNIGNNNRNKKVIAVFCSHYMFVSIDNKFIKIVLTIFFLFLLILPLSIKEIEQNKYSLCSYYFFLFLLISTLFTKTWRKKLKNIKDCIHIILEQNILKKIHIIFKLYFLFQLIFKIFEENIYQKTL